MLGAKLLWRNELLFVLLGVQVQFWEPVSLWLSPYLESFPPLLFQTLPSGFLFHLFLVCEDSTGMFHCGLC